MLFYFCVFSKHSIMNILSKTKTMIGKIFTNKRKTEEFKGSVSQEKAEIPIDPLMPVKEYAVSGGDTSFLYESGEVLEIANRLLLHMENAKPYLNPKLKLDDMAEILNTNRSYLSRTVNGYMRLNFSQLCNYFRVREACVVYLRNPGLSKKEWIKRSGFSSLSSFAGNFSKYTGMSPARWQKDVLQRIKNKELLTADDYIKSFRCTLYR